MEFTSCASSDVEQNKKKTTSDVFGVKPVIQPIRAKNIYKSSPF